ncbi:MAG: hypothetical protein KAT13_06850, partial [Methanosarcinales archaeon]|nr:hypothetical protein [Methanosarcinales archaeon]
MNNRTTIMIALLAVVMIAGAANAVATDVSGDGAVVNETVSTASASEISDTTPEISSASLAHDAISEYEGAENCLVCHRQIGEDFKDSIHNTWL